MISDHNIRGYHIQKAQLKAFLEDHSPDLVTMNETFTKKGYKYNTDVTRDREHNLATPTFTLTFTEIEDIQLTKTTDNEQLTVALCTDSNRELYVSTVYCPHGNPSIVLIEGLCENGARLS